MAETSADRALPRAREHGATIAVWTYLAVVLVYHRSFTSLFESPALQNWATILVSLTLQALPFLVLGVTVSAAISSLVPASWLAAALPSRERYAIPLAGIAGGLLPGCECSAAPVAGRLVSRGVRPAAALTFLLAAPAINPIVLVSTSVAFPGRPAMVVARLVASFGAATVVGALWHRFGDDAWLERRLVAQEGPHAHAFADTLASDFLQAGGFLVLGTVIVATLQTLVPPDLLETLGGAGLVSVLVLALAAVVLSICSEADAFVAAGLTRFSMTARLVFLVVGPMVDLKLIALQTGVFGRRFARWFAPVTFVTATAFALLVGTLLL